MVAGGMRSIHDTFWGRFVDRNRLGAKTPRLPVPYEVTARNYGRYNRKPPVTANVILARQVYDDQPLDRGWMYGDEDYEWFWRIAKGGHRILFTDELTGRHHHRRSFRQLVTEYRRAAGGCAQFIKTHPEAPWPVSGASRPRPPLAGLAGVAGLAGAMATGHAYCSAVALVMGVLMAREFAHSRTPGEPRVPGRRGGLSVLDIHPGCRPEAGGHQFAVS